MKNSGPIKLGVVGQPSSGKDTFATYLKDHYGFTHISTGDFIRFYVLENNLGEPTRPLLQQTANFLREKYGPDHLMKMALKSGAERIVISGLRNIAEAETLKKNGGKLVEVSVPIEQRYKWALARGRSGDDLTFEEFKRQQAVEESNADPNAQNVDAVIKMADYVVENYASIPEFHKKIDEFMNNI